MRKMTFAVYNPPKEGLPYLSAVIAPTGAVAAVAYPTAGAGRNRPRAGQIRGGTKLGGVIRASRTAR